MVWGEFFGILIGLAGVIAIVISSLRANKAEDHDTILLPLFSDTYTGEYAIHGVNDTDTVIKKDARGGLRYYTKYFTTPKDAPTEGIFGKSKKAEVMVEKLHIIEFPKGMFSKTKTLLLAMPRDVKKLPEKFFESPMGHWIAQMQSKLNVMSDFLGFIQAAHPELINKVRATYMHDLKEEEVKIFKELQKTTESEKKETQVPEKKGK